MEETPAAEKLLKKILELQESQENLQREMSRLKVSAETKRPQRRPRRNRGDGTALWRKSHGAGKFTDNQYLNMLQSMAQAVHVIDLNGLIIFWNSMAEKLYGFSTSEALGKDPIDILVEGQDTAVADNITLRCRSGESWTGEFPYKNKSGDRLSVVTTISPFYDHAGSLVGIICISNDSSVYHLPSTSFSAGMNGVVSKLGFGSQQPIPADIASKISDLASKMGNKVRLKRAGDDSYQSDADQREDSSTSGASTPRGDFVHTPFGVFLRSDDKFCWNPSSDENDGNSVIPKTFTTRAEEWIAKKGLPWPWKGRRHAQSVWPWVQNEQQQQEVHQSNSFDKFKPESQACEGNKHANKEVTGSWSPCINASSCVMDKVDTNRDCLDYEILWEDLTIKEKMGQGSCGTVYRGLWFGSEVAVKVFPKQEYPDEIITSFRQEVSLMKRLRNPNVLLFMGAVASPQRLCIVTEFLPRGSLFGLLKRNTSKLDWRRRIRVALDIARGMNYLHHCSPPIIHRDLKSSNLLVDRNWTVKVADFGLSRIKHATYLTTKTGRGTPQWMAPEVLRNEAADEKSDVYSFGVILWELVTEKIPWENLNAMQVIGSVGFMNQRLEVPNDVDPQWISLMESCWDSEPQHRPSFKELMEKLRELQRKYTKELQAASVDNSSVKEK